MGGDQPEVSIIILNWNGWQDTVECLESVLKNNYQNYKIILLDNGSTDDSIEQILAWAKKGQNFSIQTSYPQFVLPVHSSPLKMLKIDVNEKNFNYNENWISLKGMDSFPQIILICNRDNFGFAAGNNMGIKFAKYFFNSDYIYLLNNDTVIEPDTISNLINYLRTHPEFGAATSAIYHYSMPHKIANLGGKLNFWGTQRYYIYSNNSEAKRVSFTTGCALMVSSMVFDKVGLLSEKFFFGEEDFEFSLRLRKYNIQMVCVVNSKVYHKTSISSEKLYHILIKKKFIHVFNRVLNLRDYFSYPVWWLWRWSVLFYSLFWLTIKHRESFRTTLRFIKSLEKYTRIYSDAKKETVERIYQEVGL